MIDVRTLYYCQKLELLKSLYPKRLDFRVDILDCAVSCKRARFPMSFEEALELLKPNSHFTIIKRKYKDEYYIEVSFSTLVGVVEYIVYLDVPDGSL